MYCYIVLNSGIDYLNKIKVITYLKLKPFVFDKWSTNLPGVAIIMWGFFANNNACDIISIPPTITTLLTPILAPKNIKSHFTYISI